MKVRNLSLLDVESLRALVQVRAYTCACTRARVQVRPSSINPILFTRRYCGDTDTNLNIVLPSNITIFKGVHSAADLSYVFFYSLD